MKKSSLLGRLTGFLLVAILMVLGVMFSAVLLIFIVAAGLIVFAYLWWKTRALRKQMREQTEFAMKNKADIDSGNIFAGSIIEGEITRKIVTKD